MRARMFELRDPGSHASGRLAGLFALLPVLPLILGACAAPGPPSAVRVAHLGHPGEDARGFEELRAAFEAANPGYGIEHTSAARRLDASTAPRAVFVQGGQANAAVTRLAGELHSDLTVGDIICLRPGQSLRADAPLQLVTFTLPRAFPKDLPTFVRPDWDPNITDTPGGCATEEGAYRRILLTWLDTVGPYVYHALNAHRVRIMDSFTHYHPIEGGFDELYLVQMVQPNARVLVGDAVDAIEARAIDAGEADELLHEIPLAVGDLVYLPRGTIHRGLGGVLAQVITAPGFRPGAEIGLDHHLFAINAALGLTGDAALPYHAGAAQAPVIR